VLEVENAYADRHRTSSSDLVDETTISLHELIGENTEWHTITLKAVLLDVVSRLSSRVFLGKPLCHNKRWLEIAKNYTVYAFLASRELRGVHPLLRPVKHWFMDSCIQLRKAESDARKLINPEVAVRKERTEKALAAGEKAPKVSDTIGWMVEVARGRNIDYAGMQLGLTLAAVHTTSESLSRAIFDLCEFPQYVELLREEVIRVVGQEGWSKTGLYKLRLMDSFLKESQRYHAKVNGTYPRLVCMPRTID
jgi:hypothetical protein